MRVFPKAFWELQDAKKRRNQKQRKEGRINLASTSAPHVLVALIFKVL